MTRHLPVLLLAALALLLGSCDRFPHNFGPPSSENIEEALFLPLEENLNSAPNAGIDLAMSHFADDYNHFGITKAERQAWLEGLISDFTDISFAVTVLETTTLTDSTALANWRLVAESNAGRAVVADSTFTGERLVKREGHWFLRGNQTACIPQTPLQRVIVEYFSFLGCPNCPVVEEKLHELQVAYPDQFTFMENHISGPLMIPGNTIPSYYGVTSGPTSVFQGQVKLAGSTSEELDNYSPLTAQYAAQPSIFRYRDPSFGISGNTINGSVILENLVQQFDPANLVLNYVLIERESPFGHTSTGPRLKNVVRARGTLDISAADLSQPIQISLTSSVTIPPDASLVIFAQTKPATFNNNAVIHGGIELELDVPALRGKRN